MKGSLHLIVVNAVVTALFLCSTPTQAQERASKDSSVEDHDSWLSGGLDWAGFHVANHRTDSYGLWLGGRLSQTLRLKIRLFTWFPPIPAPIDVAPTPDSVVGGGVRVSSIGLDIEWSGVRTGGFRWPLGIMGGSESVRHSYRTVPYGPEFKDGDEYFILEPWIGVHLVRGKNSHGFRVLLEILTVAVGYRVPFHANLPGYRSRDFAGPIFYVTFSGPQR